MTRENAVRHPNQQFSPTTIGKALVTAYESLSIDLARPQIRARMEKDMDDIAQGRATRQDVVKAWMGVMTPLLRDCMAKTSQLKASIHSVFQVWVFGLKGLGVRAQSPGPPLGLETLCLTGSVFAHALSCIKIGFVLILCHCSCQTACDRPCAQYSVDRAHVGAAKDTTYTPDTPHTHPSPAHV